MSGLNSFQAIGMSRKDIRAFTCTIRNATNSQNTAFFPIIKFLEHVLPIVDQEFTMEILPTNQMGARYGVTYPENHLIVLDENVYENAIAGIARDRFTIAHEIGHYLMHTPNRVSFARTNPGVKLKPYLDPEWQANTFAGELLAPANLISGMSIKEVAIACGVSNDVARIQLKNI